MNFAVGIILLLTFFALAWYCIKGYNLMIGFLIITLLWTVLSLKDLPLCQVLNHICQSAPEAWGSVLVNICWGTWFGRVLIETDIASTLIRKTVELSGDKPVITISLLNLATALIFTSMTGAGPVIAIGVIMLPLLMSLGIPKAVSLFTFMGSVAAGIYLNPINFSQHRIFFLNPSEMPEFNFSWYASRWGWLASIIMLAVTTMMTMLYLSLSKTRRQWAAQTHRVEHRNAPGYALIVPFVPVILNIAFNFPVIGGLVISGFAALLMCGKMSGTFQENCSLVNKLYYDAVVDTAPLAGFILTVPMFNAAATYASPYFNDVIGGIMPRSELTVCLVFAALLFMGLFRGPLALFGCGAATLGVLANSPANFPVHFLYGVFIIPSITVNVASCITQSCVAWGLAYTKSTSRDFLTLSIPNAYFSGILQYISVYFLLTGSF
ncbi:MAG: hypothetical protein IJT58_03815 [Synergistaceae bacterium]|nr:hypothetical protein [Synergistaceae bacterium]